MVDKTSLAWEVAQRQDWLQDMRRLQRSQGGQDGLSQDGLGLLEAGDKKPIKIAQTRSTSQRAQKVQRAIETREARDQIKRKLEGLLSLAEEKAERRKKREQHRPGGRDGPDEDAPSASRRAPPDGGEEEGHDPSFLVA